MSDKMKIDANASRRSVSTDALETLGTIIDERAGRDAIHVAVEPVIAGETLKPGEHIGLSGGKAFRHAEPILGIVDPFIPVNINTGDRFWMLLLPRTITSLRHVWSHPAFENMAKANEEAAAKNKLAHSENWLRSWLEHNNDNPGYDVLYKAVTSKSGKYTIHEDGSDPDYPTTIHIDGDYVHVNGSDAHGEIPPEFWDHMEVVTGEKITKRPSYFSCSC